MPSEKEDGTGKSIIFGKEDDNDDSKKNGKGGTDRKTKDTQKDDDTGKTGGAEGLRLPILEHLLIRNSTLALSGDSTPPAMSLLVQRLEAREDNDTGDLIVKCDGTLNGKAFAVEGRSGSVATLFDPGEIPYPVDLHLEAAAATLHASGTIEAPLQAKGLALKIEGQAAELAEPLKMFGVEAPALGRLTVSALLSGGIDALSASRIKASLSREENLRIEAEGSIGDLTGDGEVRIAVSGGCSDADVLRWLLPGTLPSSAEVTVNGELEGAGSELRFEGSGAYGSRTEGIDLHAAGSVRVGATGGDLRLNEMDLKLKVTTTETAKLRPFLFDALPELGPISATLRIRGGQDRFRIEEISARAVGKTQLTVEVSGDTRHQATGDGNFSSRFNLRISAAAPHMKWTEPVLGIKNPGISGPIQAHTRLTGTEKTLSLSDVRLAVGSKDSVRLNWEGRIGSIPLAGPGSVSGVRGKGAVMAEGTGPLFALLDIPLPDAGPLAGSFRTEEVAGKIAISDLMLSAGTQETFRVETSGRIDAITGGLKAMISGIHLHTSFHTRDPRWLTGALGVKLPDLTPVSTVTGSFLLEGDGGDLSISDAKLAASFASGERIDLSGDITGLSPTGGKAELVRSAALTLSLAASDTGPLGDLFRTKLPDMGPLSLSARIKRAGGGLHVEATAEAGLGGPVVIAGTVTGTLEEISFKGETRVGNTHFHTAIGGSKGKLRPKVTAEFHTGTLHLADFGLAPTDKPFPPAEKPPLPPSPRKSGKRPPPGRLFSDTPLPVHNLKSMDLSLKIGADAVVFGDLRAKALEIGFSLQGGRLLLQPAKMLYDRGFIAARAFFTPKSPEPAVGFQLTAEDIEADVIFARLPRPPVIGGQLSVSMDLKSAGLSPRAIASKLNGEFAFAVERGRIKRVVDLAGTDTVDLLRVLPVMGKYRKLNCLAMRFLFKEGTGESEVIFLDTKAVRLQGKAKVNLSEETIHAVLRPHSKKGGIGGSSPITISGPLARPGIRKIPLREAVRLYGDIAMAPIFLPARGLGYLWKLLKNDEGTAACLPAQTTSKHGETSW